MTELFNFVNDFIFHFIVHHTAHRVCRLDRMEKAFFFNTESLRVLFRECSPDIIQFSKCMNLFDKLC